MDLNHANFSFTGYSCVPEVHNSASISRESDIGNESESLNMSKFQESKLTQKIREQEILQKIYQSRTRMQSNDQKLVEFMKFRPVKAKGKEN